MLRIGRSAGTNLPAFSARCEILPNRITYLLKRTKCCNFTGTAHYYISLIADNQVVAHNVQILYLFSLLFFIESAVVVTVACFPLCIWGLGIFFMLVEMVRLDSSRGFIRRRLFDLFLGLAFLWGVVGFALGKSLSVIFSHLRLMI